MAKVMSIKNNTPSSWEESLQAFLTGERMRCTITSFGDLMQPVMQAF